MSPSFAIPRFDGEQHVVSDCAVDTLYSWGPEVKIRDLERRIGANGPWQGIRALYSTVSPITTFGYGPLVVRIKLKPNIIFQASGYQSCAGAQPNTVYVRYDSFADWTICDPSVIHSWSYGTPEIYDEIVREMKKYEATPQSIFYYEQGEQGNLFNFAEDRHKFRKGIFKHNLDLLREIIQNNQGHIYFNPDLPAEEKTRQKHYETRYPLN
jgi:hypothetical protein